MDKYILAEVSYENGYQDGYQARCREMEEYKWHDLRKDPNDLPKDMENVLICWIGGSNNWYDTMFWNEKERIFSVFGKMFHPIIGDERYEIYGKTIAWRRIEPFEETEELE